MNNFNEEFLQIANPIIKTNYYERLRAFIHHGRTSIYEHSVDVAYQCFLYAKKKKCRLKELVIAALLHDYYLYDWHDKKKYNRKGLHGFTHPKTSVQNAIRDFNVSKDIQKIMISHMFPLTLFHIPTSKEGWVLSYYDKKCALKETFKRKYYR